MSVLSKGELLQAMALKTERIELSPGREVIVSEIGAGDLMALYSNPDYQDADGAINMVKLMPALVACSVVDESGQRVFGDDDIPSLARASQGPFMKLTEACRRLNGMDGSETKNSEETAPDVSLSGSVSISE